MKNKEAFSQKMNAFLFWCLVFIFVFRCIFPENLFPQYFNSKPSEFSFLHPLFLGVHHFVGMVFTIILFLLFMINWFVTRKKIAELPLGNLIAAGLVWLMLTAIGDIILSLSFKRFAFYLLNIAFMIYILYSYFARKDRKKLKFFFIIGTILVISVVYFTIVSGHNLNREICFQQIYYLIMTAVLLFFLTQQIINSQKRISLFLKIILFTGAFVALLGILELIFKRNILYEKWFLIYHEIYIRRSSLIVMDANLKPTGFYGRVFSTIGHPAYLSQFLIFPMFIGFYYLLKEGEWKKKISYAISVILILFCMGITLTRASWLGSLAGIAGIILTSRFFIKNIRKIYIFAGLILLSCIVLLSIPVIRKRVYSRLFVQIGTTSRAFGHRFQKFESVKSIIRQKPFMGLGFGMYYFKYKDYLRQDQYYKDPTLDIVDNQYLELLCEIGLSGGIILFLWILYNLSIIWNYSRYKKDLLLSCLFWGLVSFGISVAMLGSFITWSSLLATFTIYLGLAWKRIYYIERNISLED
ncbi:MAG: O-antigen ligase family protein [Candidatus Coatesbacteria bacterium]|nr:O-antigen ligase family protein [Candidatus Coatesbacteria bacterium]